MYKKLVLFVLSIAIAITSAACNKSDVSKKIVNVPMGNTPVETSIKKLVKDTCNKRADGTCKTMGEN